MVSTTLGAEGIVAGPDCIRIADTPEAFAEGVLDLLGDPALFHHQRAEARRLAESFYDWPVIIRAAERALAEAVAVA